MNASGTGRNAPTVTMGGLAMSDPSMHRRIRVSIAAGLIVAPISRRDSRVGETMRGRTAGIVAAPTIVDNRTIVAIGGATNSTDPTRPDLPPRRRASNRVVRSRSSGRRIRCRPHPPS